MRASEIDWSAVGRRIQAKRLAAGLTQQQLAESIGDAASRQRVSNIERGVGGLSVAGMKQVADALSCTVDELLEGKKNG